MQAKTCRELDIYPLLAIDVSSFLLVDCGCSLMLPVPLCNSVDGAHLKSGSFNLGPTWRRIVLGIP